MRWAAVRNASLALLLAIVPGPQERGARPTGPTSSPFSQFALQSYEDPRLVAERGAALAWRGRLAPERQVVDLVCLVPDVPTFLATISAWDDRHAFPILLDDADLSFKFLEAFRPARVVRLPSLSAPVSDDEIWNRAVRAVGRTWIARERQPEREASLGGRVPPTRIKSPGVVLSAPESPLLAGAVALAAGRFQPLLRWEPGRSQNELLELDEAQRLAAELEAFLSDRVPHHGGLGDSLDFVTLAGDWPYRYQTTQGPNAFDDLIGRSPRDYRRHAYVGRLVGTPAAALYQAMCSLFLQPDSALLFNTYSEKAPAWSLYEMRSAAERLGTWLDVTHLAGLAQASMAGWHEVFDPRNRFGLIMINSSGTPDRFVVERGWGHTGDIPASVPAAVIQIHSHSASDPTNPATLAGRWLVNGAFLYVGAMNEPQLQGFRTPALEAELISRQSPLAAAVRQSAAEPFGMPWRIVYLGDPLYRLTPGRRRARLGSWKPVADWKEVRANDPPPPASSDEDRLEWALNQSLLQLVRNHGPMAPSRILSVLFSVRRERLASDRLVLHDNLLAQLLDRPQCARDVRIRLDQLAPGSLTAVLERRLEASRMAALHQALAQGNLVQAGEEWNLLIRSSAPRTLKEEITARISTVADRPRRLQEWRAQLRTTLLGIRSQPDVLIVAQELERVEKRLGL